MPVRPWRTTCLSYLGGQHACHTQEDNMHVRPGRKHACHTWEYNMSDIPRRTCQSEQRQYACQTMEDSMLVRPSRTTCLLHLGAEHVCQTQDNMPVRAGRKPCLSDPGRQHAFHIQMLQTVHVKDPNAAGKQIWTGPNDNLQRKNKTRRTAGLSDPAGQHACHAWEENMFV